MSAFSILEENGIKPTIIDYLTDPQTKNELVIF